MGNDRSRHSSKMTMSEDDLWKDILNQTLSEASWRRKKNSYVDETDRPKKGKTLVDTYHVLSDAYEGGMGAVWKVSCNYWPDTCLAMKRPKPEFFKTKKQKEDFIHECESWINLGLHPNIVTCYYVNEVGGVPTIFSEWMERGNIESCIGNGTLYEGSNREIQERLLDITIQFARGLRYAHEKGLVHQDVKPGNLLATGDWEVKVSDFGLAKARAYLSASGPERLNRSEESDMTQMAQGGGKTPAYCSPEQAAEQMLTQRTDIYSWAVSVLEMYLGYKPWAHGRELTGPLVGIACRDYFEMCSERPIPKELQELLAKCMLEDPNDRPHDFGEVEKILLDIYRDRTGSDYFRGDMKGVANTADSLNNQAVSYMEIGLEDSAMRCLERAGTIDSYHVEAMYNRALIDWRKGTRTSVEVHRQLTSHPYFLRTENGRQALEALAREAGKADIDSPLMEGVSGHSVLTSGGADFRYHQYLWKGKVYIIAPVPTSDKTNCREQFVMTVYDAVTGAELDRDDFSRVRRSEESGIIEIVLNNECTQALLSMSGDKLILYDLASRTMVRKYALRKTSMYDTRINLRIIGDDIRFIRYSVSHGIGHVPPTRGMYDLRTETFIEEKYSDWELIKAGADAELGPPKRLLSLSDGRSAIPVFEDERGIWYCDEKGNPEALLPTVLAERVGSRVLRITDDRRIWLCADEGLMEIDLNSGKSLRSFMLRRFSDNVSVDKDGLGILVVNWNPRFASEGRKDKTCWYYRRLDPIRQEDRAQWLFSPPENFAQHQDRIRCIRDIMKSFDYAAKINRTVDMVEAFDNAMAIRCFYGTAEYWDMSERLNRRCRQYKGEFFIYMEGSVNAVKRESEEIFFSSGLGKAMPEDLIRRIWKEIWVLKVTPSPDGQRVLILSREDSNRLPAGPGIYLMDVPTEKLYLIKKYPGKKWNTVGFCNDRTHIVYGNISRYRGESKFLQYADISDGSRQAYDIGDWEPTGRQWENLYHSKKAVPGTYVGNSILWPNGIYSFADIDSRNAFFDQSGKYLEILDACESHGLIVYSGKNERFDTVLRVWSVDEQRNLMETFRGGQVVRHAFFGLIVNGVLRLIVQWSGSPSVEIYQFRCSYSSDKPRRLPPIRQREWPELKLPECKWSGARSEESILRDKALSFAQIHTAESMLKAYDIYCGLIRRFPNKKHHRKSCDGIIDQLKILMKERSDSGDVEALEKYTGLFEERLKNYPDEEKTPELFDFTEELLANVLSERDDADSKQHALALYERLLGRVEDRERIYAYSKKVKTLRRQLRHLEKESQMNGSGLFSFLRRKK